MKRKIVLLVLLALPLVLYIYFSLVKHNSLYLPVITKNVSELPQGKTFAKDSVKLEGQITVLGFTGTDVARKKESIFNINQKINSRYKDFTDFQIVMVAPEGTEADVQKLQADIKTMADTYNWKFVFLPVDKINALYSSLKAEEQLDNNHGTFNIFIVDKKRSLRGRNGENKKGEHEYRDSYNSFSASELHNEMTDDVKIVLREYRLALKSNNAKGMKREI
jgi:hypothetical protein